MTQPTPESGTEGARLSDFGRSLALAQQLRDHAALIRQMDKIANGNGPIQTHEATARLLEAGAAEIERLAELADKYKWQVRDTCARAEKAEAAAAGMLAALKAFVKANQGVEDYSLLEDEATARRLAIAAISKAEAAS